MNCNNTIPATLDLTQSIKSFESTIAAEMSLLGVCQWDGRTICEPEQSVRQAALILAGECKRIVVIQAVPVKGSPDNCIQTNAFSGGIPTAREMGESNGK